MNNFDKLRQISVMLILLFAGWASGCPLWARTAAVDSHLLSLKWPNKNGVNFVSYTYYSESESFTEEGQAYIPVGETVDLLLVTNPKYILESVTVNGVAYETQRNYNYGYGSYEYTFPFTMPSQDVEVVYNVKFNPESPAEPQRQYQLRIVSNPTNAASDSERSWRLENERVTVSPPWTNAGYRFVSWTHNGNVVSTLENYSFSMPASDMVLTANYKYNPSNPNDPEQPKLTHPLTAISSPAGAADMYTSSSRVLYGERYSVQAYPRSGYVIRDWKVNGVSQGHDSYSLSGIMTDEGAQVECILEYNPTSPGNPGANSFDRASGQVIIDEFEPGRLSEAMRILMRGNDYSNVNSVIVKGVMNYSDLDFIKNLERASLLDLSRTGGWNSVINNMFMNSDASNIILPPTIDHIEGYAFSGCANLTSITLYSDVPPTCSDYAFENFRNIGVCTIYVPETAVSLYESDLTWSQFLILPIQSGAHVLQVNLPQDASDGRFKNYVLEIVNVRSGVRQKYVVSDRLLYTFNSLQKDEQYNIYLRSQAGMEVARIENVTIPESDIEVSFPSIKELLTMEARITDSEGNDVTNQASIEWLRKLDDGSLSYLRKERSISEIPEGQALVCRVSLNSDLGVKYIVPGDLDATASDATKTIDIELTPFRTITLSGKVTDDNGNPISGATISALQTLNGKFGKSYTATTNLQGEWTMTVADVESTLLTYAAPECVNVTATLGKFDETTDVLTLEPVAMRSIVGARISYGFTYREAGSESVDEYYSDYQNVAFSVYNVSQDRAHADLSVQYPLIAVLDEGINIGDELRLTASSKTGAFLPIEKTVTVGDNQRAQVTFDIIGKGGISASYETSENPGVIAMLYNANGEFLKKGNYSNGSVTLTGLDDGEYTLISMAQSSLMNSILRLSYFDEIGLIPGRDYVTNTLKVETGKLTSVVNPEIPSFDESLFYYTNSSTNFTTNKSSITTGNYLTLSAMIDFKGIYKDDISNVSLTVDLPEACEFVEASIVQGPNLLPYTLDNNRLTIQLGRNYQSQLRFCVTPTRGGTFTALGTVQFEYDGSTINQPIGAATCEVKDMGISVPSVVSELTFYATGVAPARSEVFVYEDNAIIGNGKVDAKGNWKVECMLKESYNLSSHSVHAEFVTPADLRLVSETKDIVYDKNAIRPLNVMMTFWNGYYAKQYEVTWDFLNATCDAGNYDFFTTTDFTFVVNFTSNDPKKVKNIVLNVFTSDNEVTKLVPIFDENLKCWVATQQFSASALPTNVSLDYEAEAGAYDANFIAENLNLHEAIQEIFASNAEWAQNMEDELAAATSETEVDMIIENIMQRFNIDTSNPAEDGERSEANILASLEEETGDADFLQNILSASLFNDAVSEYFEGIEISTCSGLTPESLMGDEFTPIEKSNGNFCYSKVNAGTWQFADFDNDVYININLESASSAGSLAGGQSSLTAEQWLALLEQVGATLKSKVDDLRAAFDECNDMIIAKQEEVSKELEQLCADRQWLRENSDNSELLTRINRAIADKAKTLEGLNVISKWINSYFSQYFYGGTSIAGKSFTFYSLIFKINEAIENLKSMIALRDSLEAPHPNAQATVGQLRDSLNELVEETAEHYLGSLNSDIAQLSSVTTGLQTIVSSGGRSISSLLAIIAAMTGNNAINRVFDNNWDIEDDLIRLRFIIISEWDVDPTISEEEYQRIFIIRNDDNKYTDKDRYDKPADPIHEYIEPVLDPSGYVYEAVPENRVEGVQASIYYKETVEDMYGDLHEEIILWDAEEYAQSNPLFTDEYGKYQWDVPQGLWQVKFEKDGYVTAYSEWLPVPPPQLDVNVGIVQNKQPEVQEARAYEEGIEVQFDKFMDESTLNNGNIYVTANGETLSGSLTLIDSTKADEYADETNAETLHFASRVRFVPNQPLSITTGEIRLTVNRNVLSYAGIPMTETFTQVLDVEKEVQSITSNDVKVLYGGEKEVTIYALPYEAAVGRTVKIANSSDLIASVDKTEAVFDNEGKATVIVSGNLLGQAQLSFSMPDVKAIGACTINVVTEIREALAPQSSRADGTALYRGTKVELTTDTKNGIIYFTTDGSDPADEEGTRRKYTVPVVVNDDMQLRAVTSTGGANEEMSEIAEFNYTLRRSDMDFAMEEGWTWISHNFESALPTSTFSDETTVHRIMSQTQEAIRDPQLGLIGTLSELNAMQSYKVETTSASSRQRLSDYAWNPANPIVLNSGWNWIGYPVSQVMTVDEAFAYTDAEEMDVIVGQKGFAQFDGERWVGTLETMSPGLGYMYQSRSNKNVVYNTSIVSKAAAWHASGISSNSALMLDIHKYGAIMPMVATLTSLDGENLENAEYQVNAFCGSECRGIGRVVNGLVMMNIYGKAGDVITFSVTNKEGETQYANNAAVSFAENIIGSLNNPHEIAINIQSGIRNASYSGDVSVSVIGDMLIIKGIAVDDITLVEIYDIDGHKLLRETNVPETGINVARMSPGAYVVIVNGNGQYTYHKIALR